MEKSPLARFDDAIRHSITKMAHLHFTSTEKYRNRVIQLGENPANVFNVGAPGIDHIHRLKLLEREELEKKLGLSLGSSSLLITFHPATLEPGTAKRDFEVLLRALDQLEHVSLVFTKANADTEGRSVNEMIDGYVASRTNAIAHPFFGPITVPIDNEGSAGCCRKLVKRHHRSAESEGWNIKHWRSPNRPSPRG